MTTISVQNAVDSTQGSGAYEYDFHLEDAGLQLAISVRRADFRSLKTSIQRLDSSGLSSKKKKKAPKREHTHLSLRTTTMYLLGMWYLLLHTSIT